MIRVILQGRTGNNLFQYAAGRALSHRLGSTLVLDGSWSDQSHANQFKHLLRLPLQARYERRLSLAKRICQKAIRSSPASFHRGPVLTDPADGTLSDIDQATDGSLLIGFFQSPRYFNGIERELRAELDLSRILLPPEAALFEEALRSHPTVSIHVRRGDYVNIGATQCLGEDYHDRAIQHFRQQFEGLRFCVFSDDIPWCQSRFSGNDFLFCDFPAAATDPMHDLRLMAACQHHIIVNSSYSWWGAWLNPSPTKTVVAPQMWMTNTSAGSVVPPSWVLM